MSEATPVVTVCRSCGRVVNVTPLRPGATVEASTFFTVDDHEGADGRCAAVGDVVTVKFLWRTRRPGVPS